MTTREHKPKPKQPTNKKEKQQHKHFDCLSQQMILRWRRIRLQYQIHRRQSETRCDHRRINGEDEISLR